jgi:DNA polymerase III alpha subunit
MAHYDRDTVEDLKLIKLDLLSVRGLAAISETRKKLRARSIPAQDKRAYELLKKAQTIGCFQVESPAMMNLLRRMRPENIYELTQALALIRPGPTESGMKESLLRMREGKPFPAMASWTESFLRQEAFFSTRSR